MEKNNNHPIQDLPLEEGQIIIYQPNETIKVEVKMEDETVWLTQIQMTELFQTSKQNGAVGGLLGPFPKPILKDATRVREDGTKRL